MKKGFLLFAIVLWCIIAVTIIVAIIFAANGKINYEAKETLVKNESISLGKTQNIVVEGTRQTLEICKTSGDSINIRQYGHPNNKNQEMFIVSTHDNGIHIFINKALHINIFDFYTSKERLVVEIPEGFSGNLNVIASSGSIKIQDEFILKNVHLRNSSGSTHINKKLTADTLNIKTSSGSIKFNGEVVSKEIYGESSCGSISSSMSITANDKIVLKNTSGGIHFGDEISTKDLDATARSGSIHLTNVNVKSYNLQCSSGSIKVDGISGGGNVKTSSGSIKLLLNKPNGNINLNATSGSIKVELEPSLQFKLNAKTNSGSIRTNFAVQKNGDNVTASVGDNPVANINANSSSGGIKIECR